MIRRLLAVAILALLASGAAVAASGMPAKHVTAAPTPTPTPKRTTPPPKTRPRPVRTVVVSGPTLQAGQTGIVSNPAQGMSLRLTAARPSISRTRLSSSYGYPPEHGFYVTFTMTVVNHGSQPLRIGPLDFFTQVPAGGRKTTTEDGAAPYSGASAQFDNTFLDPGESYSAPLTFDVSATHGVLSYAPDGSPAVSWRF